MLDKRNEGNGRNGGADPKATQAQPVTPGAGAIRGDAEAKTTMGAARTMIQSRVDLPEEARSKICGVLEVALASSLDLYSQVKQAHWNVIGPHFIAYHELFDQVAEHAIKWVDLIAERTATLGGVPQGTVRMSATLTRLPDYTLGAAEGPSHVEALSERLQHYCALIRESAERMEQDDMQDLATQDLLIEVLRQGELDLWFLDKHTQRAAPRS
jgi:starvation-inducible DNA-binding protein